MFKIIAVIIIVLVGALLLYAATKPNTFRVQRSANIHASPEKIYGLINDLHEWRAWSPYEKLDPAMKRTLSGADSGKGAIYEWVGNSKVGTGSLEITNSVPSSRVDIKLDMLKPIEGHSLVAFTLQPAGELTEVTWSINGPVPYLGKIMHTLFNMDHMIGGQFEQGLASLKSVAEK
jgi:hypothetical protein